MASQPSPLNGHSSLKLQIDTSNLNVDISTPSIPRSPSSPSGRGRSRSFSQTILPSFRLSTQTSPKPPAHSRSESTPQGDPSRKYRDESRKLLTHILAQLHNRPKPPSVFDAFRTDAELSQRLKDFRTAAISVKGVIRFKGNLNKSDRRKPPPLHDDSDSDNDHVQFSTDVAFDLMTQLVSALAVAVKGNWQVFDDE
jgi:hypothetical protein